MGEENQASAIGVESGQISDTKFSINVLQLLKSSQMRHGVQFGDYTHYRRYCDRRLKSLYKVLNLPHCCGNYAKRAISVSSVTEVRYLHVVLYAAERSWTEAMEKRQLPDVLSRQHRKFLIHKLRRAAKWGTVFADLCSVKGDSRTSLEAEAYASYMRGTSLFEENKNWDIALKDFKKARTVYEELGKYGDLENQVLCRERVEELEPSICYCLHKIEESDMQTSEHMQIGEMEGPALDLFRTKLEAVMAEERSQQAASMTEFHWLGHIFPIHNAKTRMSILKAQELEKDLNGPTSDSVPTEEKVVMFDKFFTAYHEARGCVRNDLVTAGTSENTRDVLSGLDKATGAVLGERTIERNQQLVSLAKSKPQSKPEELVRLYDLLQNTGDLSDLVSSGRDIKPEELALAEECTFNSLVFPAQRCFYLAKFYSLAGERTEAYALFCRAGSLANDALNKLQNQRSSDEVMMKDLKILYDSSISHSCIEHATGIVEEKAPEHPPNKISTVSIAGADENVMQHNLPPVINASVQLCFQ